MTALVLSTDAPTVPGPPQGQWTYADWEELPDDGNRYEIIDGVLYMTTAPSSFHQWIVNRLERHITIPAEDQGLAFAFTAPIGVIMPGCDPVQPDFVVVLASRESIFREGGDRMKSDIQIAQEAQPRPIVEIGAEAGLHEDELELYGGYKAKVLPAAYERLRNRSNGKLVIVTCMTPTVSGEGKTTTTIG